MRKRSNPNSEANIRRIDSKPKAQKQTHGFQVHFLRGTVSVTKMFSDTVYGGIESARRAARKFKRSAMADLPDRMFAGPVHAPIVLAKKTSGKKTSPAGGKKTAAPKGAKKSASAKAASKSRR